MQGQLLLLRLFPSSGFAGIGIVLGPKIFHFVLSSASSSFDPTLSISISHWSLHLVFCLLPRLFPCTGASSILLSTCPSYLREFNANNNMWNVLQVTPGTPAQGKLTPGDAILAIETYDATELTHMQASQLIQGCGMMLNLTLDK